MLKVLLVLALPILACSEVKSFLVETEDEIINGYKTARALLTKEQEEFLMELLAADDALIEAQTSRGIVDDILMAIAGVQGNSNIRVNIIGGGSQQQQQPNPATAAANNPPVTLINPTFQVVSPSNQQEKALINSTDTASATSQPPASSSAPGSSSAPASSPPQQSTAPPTPPPYLNPMVSFLMNQMTTTTSANNQTTTTIGGTNNHLFSTISQVIMNSSRRNVTGIVDESLRIATPAPIREFVTGILNVVYCNGIRRLLGRC